MYAHFYQLSEDPFNLTPDPKFQYVNDSTREALASMLHGINARKGFVSLIGEAGTGKTTLLKRVVDEIEGEASVVFVFYPPKSFDEFLNILCRELGIATGADRLIQLQRLNEYLLEQLTDGRNVVVMLDEAQTVDDGVLEELRLLSNLETAKEKILQIVLSGQPELEEKLRRPNLRQLRQRIGVRATLSPMRSDEIADYVATRLRAAGADRTDLFTPGALRLVWQASSGIPRVVNKYSDNAMLIAFAEGRDRVTAAVMRAAIRDQEGRTRLEEVRDLIAGWFAAPVARYAAAAVASVAVVLPLALLWTRTDAPPPPVVETPVVAPLAVAPGDPVAQERRELRREQRAERRKQANPTEVAGAVPGEAAGEAPGEVAAVPADVLERMARAEEAAGDTAARLYDPGATEPAVAGVPVVAAPESEPAGTDGLRWDGESGAEAELEPDPLAAESEPAAVAPEEDPSLRIERRSLADAQDLAALALSGRRPSRGAGAAVRDPVEPAPVPVAPPVPANLGADPTLMDPSTVGARRTTPTPGQAVVGRLVRVRRGDTLWAIAVQYYGAVDAEVMTRIFQNNAGIADPRRLEVGSFLYLPFLNAEQMVQPTGDGSFRVLLAESPDEATVRGVASWVTGVLPGASLDTVVRGRTAPVRMLYATGFGSRGEAVSAAATVLQRYGGGIGRRSAQVNLVAERGNG